MRLLLLVLCISLLACEGSESDDPGEAGAAGSEPGAGATDEAPPAPDEIGPEAVGHESFMLIDAARDDRALPVDIWYPADPEGVAGAERTRVILQAPLGIDSEVAYEQVPVAQGPLPVLVFSHGYQGIRLQSVPLMEALASHGFVIATVDHTGNTQSTPDDSFDEAAANRVPDVSAVIDELLARSETASDRFAGALDAERIGVLGNSFGAMTAVGMASGWAGASPDPRVRAIAPISAVFVGEMQSDTRDSPNAGFTDEQLASITVPVMLMGGTEDVNVPIGNNAHAFERLTAAEAVYRVDILGATHTHFASICLFGDLLIEGGFEQDAWPALGAGDLLEPYETTCGPEAFPIEEASRLQNLFNVAFFRIHLAGDGRYARYLTAAFAEGEENARVEVR